jgi:hypothetical protein
MESVLLHRFFEQITRMITEFAKQFIFTALILLGGLNFAAAQTDGHGEFNNKNHSNQNVQDAGHNLHDDLVSPTLQMRTKSTFLVIITVVLALLFL